jgi:hypothetical protein
MWSMGSVASVIAALRRTTAPIPYPVGLEDALSLVDRETASYSKGAARWLQCRHVAEVFLANVSWTAACIARARESLRLPPTFGGACPARRRQA